MNRCTVCQTDISHKRRDALRCDRCLQDRINDYKRKQRALERAKPKPPRFCMDCPNEITDRVASALRCRPCARKRSLEKMRRHWHEVGRPNHKPKPRYCLDCGVSITDRSNFAKRCAKCAPEHNKAMSRKWHKENPARMRELKRRDYRKRGEKYRRRSVKQKLIARDGMFCGLCFGPLDDPFNGHQTHVDHIIRVLQGGSNDLHNLRLTHARCNLQRKRLSPLEQ